MSSIKNSNSIPLYYSRGNYSLWLRKSVAVSKFPFMQLFISYSFASILFASFQSHVVLFGPPCPSCPVCPPFFPDISGSYIIPCCRSTLSPSSLFLKTAKNPLGVAYPIMLLFGFWNNYSAQSPKYRPWFESWTDVDVVWMTRKLTLSNKAIYPFEVFEIAFRPFE